MKRFVLAVVAFMSVGALADDSFVSSAAVHGRQAAGGSPVSILDSVRDRHASGQTTIAILDAVRDRRAAGNVAWNTAGSDRNATPTTTDEDSGGEVLDLNAE